MKTKKLCIVLLLCAAVALLLFMSAAVFVWLSSGLNEPCDPIPTDTSTSESIVTTEPVLFEDITVRQVFVGGRDATAAATDERFPELEFRFDHRTAKAVSKDGTETVLYSNMYIFDAYFCDLNGDGYPEICSNTTSGSGIVWDTVYICDLKNGYIYTRTSGAYLYDIQRYWIVNIDGKPYLAENNYDIDVEKSTPLTMAVLTDEAWLFEKIKLGEEPKVKISAGKFLPGFLICYQSSARSVS